MQTKLLPRNEHNIDRTLRIVLGLALVPLAFVGPQTAWAYLGLIPLLTGLVGSCPIYTLFGVSTRPVRHGTNKATQH